MPTNEAITCACTDCDCKVASADQSDAAVRGFCSDACADGHSNGDGCGHAGCACHG